jgi:hypothetical protein
MISAQISNLICKIQTKIVSAKEFWVIVKYQVSLLPVDTAGRKKTIGHREGTYKN